MEQKSFADIVNEIVYMDKRDAELAAEAIISRQAIEIELLTAQLKALTKYAEGLYNENIDLKATQAPQEDAELLPEEKGSGDE